MPVYVMLLKYTEQGFRGIKGAPERLEQAHEQNPRGNIREIGFWCTQGAYDAVAVVEFPDDETASAHAISLGMSGDFHSETMAKNDSRFRLKPDAHFGAMYARSTCSLMNKQF